MHESFTMEINQTRKTKAGAMMEAIENTLSRAQHNVNQAFAEYESDSSTLAHEFKELKIQASIFQYEICVEMAGIMRNRPTGFSLSIALKGLVHRIYEYDQLLNKHIIRRMLILANTRGIIIDKGVIKGIRKRWKVEFKKLEKWSDIRNETTGHYGQDIAHQIELTKSIDFSEVMSVTKAFLQFNMDVLLLLKNVGAAGSD